MLTSFITIAALAASLTSASPMIKRQTAQPTADQLAQAVINWQADTGAVSNFLNVAAAGLETDNTAFEADALSAFNSENDETTQKTVFDSLFLAQGVPSIVAANDVLATQGTFMAVVNGLNDLAQNGFANIGDVDTINNGRCGQVLPAIDQYFLEAFNTLNGDESLTIDIGTAPLTAIRPFACQ